ncbi:MAG TPA: carboxypeptidase regulatory-like domain-containing protein [Anaerolineales bacterium]|nr:carboxypeptidase regulatory-like domain-containing protein [Anaerolineales bacterium]
MRAGKQSYISFLWVVIFSACTAGTPATFVTPTNIVSETSTPTATSGTIKGQVIQSETNSPAAGVFVQAKNESGVIVTVISDSAGAFNITDLAFGAYTVSARGTGFQNSDTQKLTVSGSESNQINISLSPVADIKSQLSGAAWLGLLPDDAETRQFILDCQGCHQLGWVRQQRGGWPSEAEWKTSINKMLGYYGPDSGFPIIGPVDADHTAAWLAQYLTNDAPTHPSSLPISGEAANVRITEYDFPGTGPHDLVLDQNGQVIVTGMFSNDMWSLDPASGEFTRYDLPNDANPRAVEVDSNGVWWIVFGNPFQVARFDPAQQELTTTSVGMYAHSIALDGSGNAYINGHFKANPGKVVMLDSQGERVQTFDIPENNTSNLTGLPISYDLRVDANGIVWGSDLNWNRIYRLDPQTGDVKQYEFPNPVSGPRRFDIDADGNLWIPEFSGSRLAMFNPVTETFTEWDTPTKNAEPYVVKVDNQNNQIWIGYAAGDRVARFDPATGTFTEYPLPTRFALIRYMAVDQTSGDVWFSYHHIPTAQDMVARLETTS